MRADLRHFAFTPKSDGRLAIRALPSSLMEAWTAAKALDPIMKYFAAKALACRIDKRLLDPRR